MLSVRGVKTNYGKIVALRGVDLEVFPGEIIALIGANGAGKSTLMMTICGNPRAHAGAIVYDGHNITRLPTHEIARMRIAQAPEGRRIFPRMTVLENLQMGASIVGLEHFEEDSQRVFRLFPRLKERIHQRGGTLSGGEQQMLAIARALMARPRLLLLDEPSLGLSPVLVKEIGRIVLEIHSRGIPVILVEQNARAALQVADRAYVLEMGAVALQGPAKELLHDRRIIDTYLGLGARSEDAVAR